MEVEEALRLIEDVAMRGKQHLEDSEREKIRNVLMLVKGT